MERTGFRDEAASLLEPFQVDAGSLEGEESMPGGSSSSSSLVSFSDLMEEVETYAHWRSRSSPLAGGGERALSRAWEASRHRVADRLLRSLRSDRSDDLSDTVNISDDVFGGCEEGLSFGALRERLEPRLGGSVSEHEWHLLEEALREEPVEEGSIECKEGDPGDRVYASQFSSFLNHHSTNTLPSSLQRGDRNSSLGMARALSTSYQLSQKRRRRKRGAKENTEGAEGSGEDVKGGSARQNSLRMPSEQVGRSKADNWALLRGRKKLVFSGLMARQGRMKDVLDHEAKRSPEPQYPMISHTVDAEERKRRLLAKGAKGAKKPILKGSGTRFAILKPRRVRNDKREQPPPSSSSSLPLLASTRSGFVSPISHRSPSPSSLSSEEGFFSPDTKALLQASSLSTSGEDFQTPERASRREEGGNEAFFRREDGGNDVSALFFASPQQPGKEPSRKQKALKVPPRGKQGGRGFVGREVYKFMKKQQLVGPKRS